MFKIVNRYGKSVTVTMGMKEKTVFNSEVLANIVCKFLNTKETKPDWLVNNFDVVACRPYKVERVQTLLEGWKITSIPQQSV